MPETRLNPDDPIARGVRVHGVNRKTPWDAIKIAVTVPTFKRPDHLIATLESLEKQNVDQAFGVIVMENDAAGQEGLSAAQPFFADARLNGLTVLVSDAGNCNAYNGGWLTALRAFPNLDYIAVIDDDEIASGNWLATLVGVAEAHDADCVGGPQIPVFEDSAPERHRNHPVFDPPWRETGPVPRLYSSGNLLIRTRHLRQMPVPFLEPSFNFTGGGDADFLMRSVQKGARLAWANDAAVHETVPARRLQKDWLRSRSRRNGQLSTLIAIRSRDDEVFGRVKVFAHSLALLVTSPFRALLDLIRTGNPDAAANRIHVAIGRMEGEFGTFHEQYRAPEHN